MRKFAPVLSAFWSLVLVPPTCGALAAACGSEPVGVEACRSIETARCEATTACGVSESESAYCVAFYRDQCLHGIANEQTEPTTETTNACVEALRNVAECARTGAMSMSGCPKMIALVPDTDSALILPCAVIKRTPQVLQACAFLRTSADDVSTSSSASSSSSSGDVGDAGSDAEDGG